MQKPRKIPQRMCVGCREKRDKKDLLRVVRTPEGQLVLAGSLQRMRAGAGRHRQKVRPGRLCVPRPAVPEEGPEVPGAGADAGDRHPRRGV